MSIVHPYDKTLIEVKDNNPNAILSNEDLESLCLDELMFHANSLNTYLLKVYYEPTIDSTSPGVTEDMISYYEKVTNEVLNRLKYSKI